MTGGPARAAATTRMSADDVAATELPDEAVAESADDRLAAVEAELAEANDRLLRALAETENVRRRAQRERDDAGKYAAGDFAKDLLSPVDNLRRALDAMPEAETKDPRAEPARRRRRDRARAVGGVRAPRSQADRSEGRALRPQFPPGGLRGGAPRPAGRHRRRGLAAGLYAARPAAAPGDGRRRERRPRGPGRRRCARRHGRRGLRLLEAGLHPII